MTIHIHTQAKQHVRESSQHFTINNDFHFHFCWSFTTALNFIFYFFGIINFDGRLHYYYYYLFIYWGWCDQRTNQKHYFQLLFFPSLSVCGCLCVCILYPSFSFKTSHTIDLKQKKKVSNTFDSSSYCCSNVLSNSTIVNKLIDYHSLLIRYSYWFPNGSTHYIGRDA